MGYSAEQRSGTISDNGYSAAANLIYDGIRQGRPDVYGRFLCEHIGDGIPGSSAFQPIDNLTDPNGKTHHYNNPQRHAGFYTPDGTSVVDVRVSDQYAEGDELPYWMQIASVDLSPGLRESMKRWEITDIRKKVAGLALVLESPDAPLLQTAQVGDRRRPRMGVASALRGYMGSQAMRANAELVLDKDNQPTLWVPPTGGMQQLRPVAELMDEVARLKAGLPPQKHEEQLAKVIAFPSRQAA